MSIFQFTFHILEPISIFVGPGKLAGLRHCACLWCLIGKMPALESPSLPGVSVPENNGKCHCRSQSDDDFGCVTKPIAATAYVPMLGGYV